jgi:hypothetical protein
MNLPGAAAAWRRDGFVVLPGYLAGPGLQAARRDLAAVYPSAGEYHAAPRQLLLYQPGAGRGLRFRVAGQPAVTAEFELDETGAVARLVA